MADICNQDTLILPGVDIDIKLWPTRDEFQLITHPLGLRCKLLIDEIYLTLFPPLTNIFVDLFLYSAPQLSGHVYNFHKYLQALLFSLQSAHARVHKFKICIYTCIFIISFSLNFLNEQKIP